MSYLRYLYLFVGDTCLIYVICVCLQEGTCLIYVICVCLRIVGFNIYCVVTCFVFLCLVYPVLPVSLNCSFFIAFSIFCNIYLTCKLSIDNEAFQQQLPLEYISQLIRYSSTCGSYHDFLDKALLLTRKPHLWCNCKRARVERLRSARLTPKTFKLVCVASPLIMHR